MNSQLLTISEFRRLHLEREAKLRNEAQQNIQRYKQNNNEWKVITDSDTTIITY